MRKRIGSAYFASLILPVLAFAVLMLRVMDPHSRWLALALYLAGWALLIFAIRKHARVRRHFSVGKLTLKGLLTNYWPHVTAGVALSVFGAAMLVLFPVGAAPFLRADLEQVELRVERDRARVVHASVGQERALRELTAVLARGVSTDANAKFDVSSAWASYLDYAVELDQLLQAHKYFYQINALEYPELNARSFLIGYAALVRQLHHGLALAKAIDGNRNVETWLDEPNQPLGLGGDTYFHFRRGLTRPDNLLRLQAGFAYATYLDKLGKLSDADAALMRGTREVAKQVTVALGENPDVLVDRPLDTLEKAGFRAWFPLQKGIAVAISEIRTTKRGNFVGKLELAELHARLEPADILLERRNWYVTNVGLPGFWPHAAFYLGTPAELDEYFDGEALEATDGVPPSEFLSRRYPDAFAAYRSLDPHDDPIRVIEAVGEGVVLHSLEYSANADYVAALRPKLQKKDKLASIVRAFEHYGKPYDYNFDFVTDESVVCSELVFKALQPAPGKDGVTFSLVTTSGRLVLPPNDIARKYDQEADTDARQLDFVAYFEGSEADQRAFERSEVDFRSTWRRPKWDIAQP